MRLVGGGSGDVMCLFYGLLVCFWVTASCVDDNLALVGKDIGVLGSSIHFSLLPAGATRSLFLWMVFGNAPAMIDTMM